MIYHVLANLVLVLHLTFIAFVVLGGLLVVKWRKLVWLHAAAVLWGVAIEFLGLICPLTPLENTLRQLGGEAGYAGGFIDHYVTALIYPAALTREIQVWLGIAAFLPNLVLYGWLLTRAHRGS